MQRALLVINMLNDFVRPGAPLDPAEGESTFNQMKNVLGSQVERPA